jgi:predicted nucleotidyltransferase
VRQKIEPVATDFGAIIQLLANGGIEFILIGGLAAIGHGLALMTFDVDVVYARTAENIARLVKALASVEPYLRGAPPGLPFRFDEQTARMGLNFTLRTKLGDLDLLGEVAGGGTYQQLLPFSADATAYGVRMKIVTLEKLIELKRAAGRPKDTEIIAQLEALRQEKRKLGSDAKD